LADCAAPHTLDKLAGSKAVADFGLAAVADEDAVKRLAFVHVFAGSADVELSVAGETLHYCAVVAGDLPRLTKRYIIGMLGFLILMGGFLSASWEGSKLIVIFLGESCFGLG
jgi:hypothetical protein